MKKVISLVSLAVLLLTQGFVPVTYAFPVGDSGIVKLKIAQTDVGDSGGGGEIASLEDYSLDELKDYLGITNSYNEYLNIIENIGEDEKTFLIVHADEIKGGSFVLPSNCGYDESYNYETFDCEKQNIESSLTMFPSTTMRTLGVGNENQTYTVTFNTNGGTPIEPMKLHEGDRVIKEVGVISHTPGVRENEADDSFDDYTDYVQITGSDNLNIHVKLGVDSSGIEESFLYDEGGYGARDKYSNYYDEDDYDNLYSKTFPFGSYAGLYIYTGKVSSLDDALEEGKINIRNSMGYDWDVCLDDEYNYLCKYNEIPLEEDFQVEGDSVSFLAYGYGYYATITGMGEPKTSKEGAIFGGWYNNGVLWNTEEDTVTQDMTLDAKWFADVSFDSRGGTTIPSQRIELGDKALNPGDPTREYSSFDGWYLDKDLTSPFDFSSMIITGNITLYAKYNCTPSEEGLTMYNLIGNQDSINDCFGYKSLDIGDYTIMDRNLGAMSTGQGVNAPNNSLGYYYQWGNNYGFSGGTTMEYNPNGDDLSLNNDDIPSKFSKSIFEYGPTYFKNFVGNVGITDNRILNLRGDVDNTNKSRQGPCPNGWHVPSSGEWEGLITYWVNNNDKYDEINNPTYGAIGGDYGQFNNFIPVDGRYQGRDMTNDLFNDLFYSPAGYFAYEEMWDGEIGDYVGDMKYIRKDSNYFFGYAWSSSLDNKKCSVENSSSAFVCANAVEISYPNKDNLTDNIKVSTNIVGLDGLPVRCFQNKNTIEFRNKTNNSLISSGVFVEDTVIPEEKVPGNGNSGDVSYSILNENSEYETIDIARATFDEDTTIYVEYYYNLRLYTGGTNDYTEVKVGYVGDGRTPNYILPTPVKEGYTFLGWYTEDNRTSENYSGQIAEDLTGVGGTINLYSQFKKDLTIILKSNHNTIKSGGVETTSDIVISTTIYNDNKYNLIFPEILSNENTPVILGFTLGEETYVGGYQSGDSLLVDYNQTFYAQTKKDIEFTVYPNNNRIKISETTYEENPYYLKKTVYNGTNTETFTFPDILDNENTPDILGFSTGGDYHEGDYYQTGYVITLSGSKDYFAQTKKDYEMKNATFLKGQGVSKIGNGNEETLYDSCTPATTYNSHVDDTCTVTSPKITVVSGNKPGKWNNEYPSESVITLSQPTAFFIAGTESNVYSVYYDYNGGSAGELHPSTYNGGTTLEISDPTKPGYTFTGWTDQDGNKVEFPKSEANGNYHLTANWELNQYTITFEGIDGNVKYQDNPSETYPTTRTCTYEDVFTLDTPVKAGYEFQGWQLANGTTKKVVTIARTTEDMVITGVWNTGTYNVVYNLNGGENDERNPETYNYSTTDVTLYSGTKVGYRFDGWYTNKNFTGNPVTKIGAGSHDNIVLHAKWTPIEYTITFANIQGATIENNETSYPTTRTCTYEDTFTLDTPVKVGYEFQGWRIGGSSTVSKTVTVSKTTENKTYTAEWTAQRYTITYNLNGGTNSVSNPDTFVYSESNVVALNEATKEGYTFGGWYKEPTLTTQVTSIAAQTNENVVLYAKWNANTNTVYKVHHYQESLEGGWLLKETDSLQGTTDSDVTPAVKTYEGFIKPSTQTVKVKPDGSTVVEYYYNRQLYTVTVDYDGGKDVNDQPTVTYTKKYGDAIEELIPTKAGYSFNGWNQTYPKTMPVVAGTKTIKATWTPTDYTITYNNVEYADNPGAIYGYNATTQPITLNDAYWTGYIFDGWYTQAVGGNRVTEITTSDHEDKVLYAHWTPKTNITYTVIHRRQGLNQYYNDDNLKEVFTGTNGVTATTIMAPVKEYPGFITPEEKEITIKGDGSTVVEYRYQRMRFTYESEGAVGVDIRGTTANNQYMFYDYPLTLRASVATGYTWSHWSVNTGDGEYRTFTTEQNTTIGLPAYDSIVRPVVTHNEYTLSFDTFGGVATGGSSTANQTHYYDDEITLPVVVKTGYIFQGWYTEANGQGTRYEADTRMPNNSIELKAYWIPGEVNVKVEYYLQNVDGSTYPEQPSDVLELHKLTESIYTGELKTYEGFTTPAEKSVEVLPDGTSVIRYDYARNSYTLDLNTLTGFAYVSVISTNHPNGVAIDESGAVQQANYYFGETITVTGELLTGYGMNKWNGADIIGTNSNTPTLTFTMPAQSVELTPNVTKNKYRVTYKDGDRVLAIYDVEYEDVVPTPIAPSKYGYKFTGWNPYPVSGTMPANALELQAMWESVPISGGSGGGGGGSSINKDDTKKTETEKEHNSAELTGATQEIEDKKEDEVKQEVKEETKQEETVAPINTESNQPVQPVSVDKEVLTAYEWAYKHDVTTMPTLNDANPEGVVTRGHLAKMVVNYAINVLGYTIPEKIPSECRWNDGRKDWESQEIKDYAVKSCALGLMGLDMPKFLPNMTVTRAQFGTIMSRLLWGKKYAGGKPYYRKHLNALKENNIMTQIENPEKRTELRQWVWLMLMRSAEDK